MTAGSDPVRYHYDPNGIFLRNLRVPMQIDAPLRESDGRPAPAFAQRLVWLLLLVPWASGCAAWHPLQGVSPFAVPPELQLPSRSAKKMIDLSLLRQTPPQEHLVDTGDVLGIFIEGVLGRDDEAPPVNFPSEREVAPALGYPVPVRADGTISLPWIDPLNVRGMTLREVEETLRDVYIHSPERPLLQEGRDRILVSLHKPRTYRVLVLREEAGHSPHNLGAQSILVPYTEKRGIGATVNLPVYRNDVLHALAETGGLPGLDAENTIYILRRKQRPPESAHKPQAPGSQAEGPQPGSLPALSSIETLPADSPPRSPIEQVSAVRRADEWGHSPASNSTTDAEHPIPLWEHAPHSVAEAVPPTIEPEPEIPEGEQPVVPAPEEQMMPAPAPTPVEPQWPDGWVMDDLTLNSPHVLRIPLRLAPGEVPHFAERDVILYDGDVVFIGSRDTDFFSTGGLLGGGQYALPRDYDLDVIGAIALAESEGSVNATRPTRALGGVSALNQDVTVGASKVVVLRKLPDGTQFPIKVDLYRAIRHPEERLIIQPGDHVILQYTRAEACAAFFERHILEGTVTAITWGLIFRN